MHSSYNTLTCVWLSRGSGPILFRVQESWAVSAHLPVHAEGNRVSLAATHVSPSQCRHANNPAYRSLQVCRVISGLTWRVEDLGQAHAKRRPHFMCRTKLDILRRRAEFHGPACPFWWLCRCWQGILRTGSCVAQTRTRSDRCRFPAPSHSTCPEPGHMIRGKPQPHVGLAGDSPSPTPFPHHPKATEASPCPVQNNLPRNSLEWCTGCPQAAQYAAAQPRRTSTAQTPLGKSPASPSPQAIIRT